MKRTLTLSLFSVFFFSYLYLQAAPTTATSSSATLYKRLASVQRGKSKRTGAQQATNLSCATKTRATKLKARETAYTGNTREADVDSNCHRSVQEQLKQLEMTSRARHCAWRLGIVILGVCCIAGGVYLLNNWIDMFTRMRGKVNISLKQL